MPAFAGFDADLFAYLRALSTHNDRGWFQEHKPRFETSVQQPMLAFIEAMAPRLAKISKHIRADARKTGGSLLRQHRDTRFGKDKRPYKEQVTVQFRHVAGKDIHAPGFSLHVGPSELMLGMGLWHPDGEALGRIRAAIDGKQRGWIKVRDDKRLRKHFDFAGESLKRPPQGYDKEHPLLEDLKRKDFVGFCTLTPTQLQSRAFADTAAKAYASAAPYLKFLCEALKLPF